LIFGLSEKGKQLFHFIAKGIELGKSATQILKELRELGLGYRMQDFYNDVRIIKGEMLKWDTMKFVPRENIISESLYTPSERAKAPFVTKVLVQYKNLETGEVKEKVISILHDHPMKREEIEEIAKDIISRHIPEYEKWNRWRFTKSMPLSGFRRI